MWCQCFCTVTYIKISMQDFNCGIVSKEHDQSIYVVSVYSTLVNALGYIPPQVNWGQWRLRPCLTLTSSCVYQPKLFLKTWPCPHVSPCYACLTKTLICQSHRRHRDKNIWAEKVTEQESTDDITHFVSHLYQLCHSDHLYSLPRGLTYWSYRFMSHLHTSCWYFERFQKEIYEDPRVIITGWPCRAPLLLLWWDFLGFLRDNGCPLGSVRVHSRNRVWRRRVFLMTICSESNLFNEDGCWEDLTRGLQAGV